ncbi:MAG: ABC transporter permease [Acidobacteriota bacterium]
MHDIRLAIRTLRTRPVFSVIAVATLALGIGANAAVFTVFDAVLLAPLPYVQPQQVVVLTEQTPLFSSISVTRYNYEDWRARAKSFSGMAAFRSTYLTLTGVGDPERVAVKMVSATLLPLVGVGVERGRVFGESDDLSGAEGVALLSAGFAARRFSDQSVVGQAVQLDNRPYTVVGIMPAQFELLQPADVYLPLGPYLATLPEDRGWHPGIVPIARLKDGLSLDEARVEMDAISRQLEAEHQDSNLNVRAQVTRAQDQLVQHVRPALQMLFGAVALVLLIACANVANLLLARAIGRRKEIAVRVALGAGRGRIVRQLVLESVVLACIGGAAGLGLAWFGVSFLTLTGAIAAALPRAQRIAVAWPVAFFALGLSIVTGVVFGLVPALQATRFDIRQSLNEEGRANSGGVRHRRVRAALVVAEIGLALVLLVGAGLLLRSFSALTRVAPGFNPQNLLVVNLPLSPRTYGGNLARTSAVERIIERVRALPGVQAAGMTTALPMAGPGLSIHFNRTAYPPKGPQDYVMAAYRAVTPGYLATLGVPLRSGRLLDERDHEGAPPAVVINESMARQFFHGINPIGQRIQIGTEPSSSDPTLDIVGVVGDVKQAFAIESKAEMFVPYGQYPDEVLIDAYLNTALVVRTSGDPSGAVADVRSAIAEIDAGQPLVGVRSMETAISGTVAQPRLQTVLLVIFASLAAVLAVVGVYGVMAYTVSQRSAEIGVRMALGASPAHVVAMVVWQGARLALMGIGIGSVAAVFAARGVQSLLFDVRGLDPLTFAVAPVMLIVAALFASYIPARTASRVSPLQALSRS